MPSRCTASRRCRRSSPISPMPIRLRRKAGALVQGVLGSFDSLNPFIVKGLPPQGLRAPLVSGGNIIAGYVVESLMVRGYDEPFTLYGLLAEDGRDRRGAQPRDLHARSGGALLRRQAGHGRGRGVLVAAAARQGPAEPPHLSIPRSTKAEILAERTVRFDLAGGDDRELPLILGLMPVLARHADQSRNVRGDLDDAAARQRALSGRPRRSRQERHADAQSGLLGPRSRGQSRLLEFRRGPLRLLSRRQFVSRGVQEGPVRPAQGERSRAAGRPAYDFPALRDGRVVKETLHLRPAEAELRTSCSTRAARCSPTSACARRSRCCSISNGSTTRSSSISTGAAASYFEGSELSARGRPADARERALLAPFPDAVRADVLDGTWSPPVTDGSGRDRTRPAPRARVVHGGRLRAARHRADRTPQRTAAQLRDPGHGAQRRRDEERLALLFAAQPQARGDHGAACAWWTRYNTRRGESPSIST